MLRRGIGTILCVAGLVGVSVGAQAQEVIDIPYTKFVLDNGLTLIVHEDHKAPIVAVNVWYHVGSKNEKVGKTGFAHLFEHLMFNGSENYNNDYFKPFDKVGATDMNGTTNLDRTNYFQNVPSNAVDVALWMESDRMGHLLGAIDQERLDEQRGVVQNEKRQRENQPYGTVFRRMLENSYPQGHPYSWSTIGSMEDLDAAALEDVQEWFKQYYGAANAVIAMAGDIDPQTAKAKVEKFFGDIPAGPPLARQDSWIAKRSGEHREVMQDRVPQARIIKAWNVPEWGSAEGDYLDLVSDLLVTGKNSRLYKRLVYEDQIATDVTSFAWLSELGGRFVVWATAQPGQELGPVEEALDEELARFRAEGPTAEELRRVKTQRRANFTRGIERIGGFGGKSDILAMNEVYGGSPDFYKTTEARIASATGENLRSAAQSWLSDGAFVLEVHPFSEFQVAEAAADRSKLPEPTNWPTVGFPKLERTKLDNGLSVILANRTSIPVVEFNLLLDAGSAADQFGKPGAARLALDTLDEGTKKRTSLQISEELAQLGAELGTGNNLDMSSVTLSALKENLDASLEVYSDVVLNPAFPEEDFERLRKQQLARIQREQTTPVQMALRIFPKLLYGGDHAYGLPFTGSGTIESVSSMEVDELREFHQTWFKPDNATLVVVGDVTMDELLPKLKKSFAKWKAGEVPQKNISTVEHRESSEVYVIDRPGSLQSIIFAGHVAPPRANERENAIEAMNQLLGGSFSARMNMNLREDKHWSYGARTLLVDAQGQRPFIVYAPVQTDKTKESLAEVYKELQGIAGKKPPTSDEVQFAKDKNTLTLPGRWETGNAVLNSIAETVRFGLADDHWDTYAGEVLALSDAEVAAAGRDFVYPERVVWVVVGDREEIEAGIRELNLGEIHLIDSEGEPVAE